MMLMRLISWRRPAGLLAAGLLLAASCAAGEEARQYEPRRAAAAGAPEEIGRSLGKEFGPEIKNLHGLFLRVGELSNLKGRKKLYERARAIGEKLAAEDRAELKGLADGAGIAFDDALFLNLFYDLTYGPAACRGLAAWGAATADGRLLHGRNLDWPDYPGKPLQRTNLIVNVRPKDGIEYCFLTWPGLQAVLTGTNRKGLTVAFNQLPDAPGGEALSEPVLFTLKRALRTCAGADEAVKLIQAAKPLGSGSILISDSAAKTAVVLELSGGKLGVRRPADGAAMIGNANHPTREAGLEGLTFGAAGSPTCEVAAELKKPLDVEAAKKVLADRRVMQNINMLAVVFAPAANRMHLSCGRMRAAEGAFKEYELFAEEKPAEPPPAAPAASR